MKNLPMHDIPYSTQQITDADISAVSDVLRSGWLTQGPTVPRFESAFATHHGVAHAVAVTNATAALHIACLALGAAPGKWVWTSPNSFVASANCALYCGADVDFVDIDPVTRNLSVEALARKLVHAEHTGTLPTVVIPVHFAGLPCDLFAIRALADRYGFKVLEDASHATGASYEGALIGSRYVDASVFSFHPVKIITTGEGGMVTTQDEQLAHRLRLLRSHGVTREAALLELSDAQTGAWYYEQKVLGFNYRMTDLQAALGLSQLGRMDELHRARENLVRRYDELLTDLPLRLPTHQPSPLTRARSAWHLYAVEVEPGPGVADRATVFARMRAQGIMVNVHYQPIHLQPFYRARGFEPGQFPAAEAYYRRAMSIPMYPDLSGAEQAIVVRELILAIQA